jgi:dipeptidyl aminopeptidase/acylaminoacyl peptidase
MKKETISFLKKRTKNSLLHEALQHQIANVAKSKILFFFLAEIKILLLLLITSAISVAAQAEDFALKDVIAFPFVDGLVAAHGADRVAWVRTVQGVRNVWMADGPAFTPRQATHYTADDGQELTQLTFSPDGAALLYVRGGDHDENWPAEGDLAPDPAASPIEPKITIWKADISGKQAPVAIAEGDNPAISSTGEIAFIRNHAIWSARPGSVPHRLLFDRGQDSALAFSPDGKELAFVSDRRDHALIGIYTGPQNPITYLAPSTGSDSAPVWSPDGSKIAFVRRPPNGGAPQSLIQPVPRPWAIWVADASSGEARPVWRSPSTLRGSYPDDADTGLAWAGDNLIFKTDADNWLHLYVVPASGGEARLLTPGAFMVEAEAMSRDGAFVVYEANTGAAADDADRRHLFAVPVSGGQPRALTAGDTIDWQPVLTAQEVVFLSSSAQQPPSVRHMLTTGAQPEPLANQAIPPSFPASQLIAPQAVTFDSADGLTIHGQLFERPEGAARKPAVIFVHGGPMRQMLLGWHYMQYYSNAYAVNQYLADHGFVVLSLNYRLGIGYGHDFAEPPHGGPLQGAGEYQDVLAAARFLQTLSGVDAGRIGIWGGSYGGYLTALALARDSSIFKAGVDLHGVHDWSRYIAPSLPDPAGRYEQYDRALAMKTAWLSSPDADVDNWRSPVLLIQGDDDRNVRFDQTIDLAARLQSHGVETEELVFPDEIHDFLRFGAWRKADAAIVDFLRRKLAP